MVEKHVFGVKGRKVYTIFRNHTLTTSQFKIGVPQGVVLSPILFNLYTSNIPQSQAPIQVTSYADDVTKTSTHTSTKATKTYIKPYLNRVHILTKDIQNLYTTHTFKGIQAE